MAEVDDGVEVEGEAEGETFDDDGIELVGLELVFD